MNRYHASSPTKVIVAMQSGMIRVVARMKERQKLSVREEHTKDPENYQFMFDHVHMSEINILLLYGYITFYL